VRVVSAVKASPCQIEGLHELRIDAQEGAAYSGIAFLGLVRFAREDDQALFVGQKSLNIELLSLFAKVSTAVIDNDTKP